MSDGMTVLKVGGNEVDDAAWIAALAGRVASLTGPVVVVHGGGKEVTEMQRALGAEPEWRDGLRVTTPAALRAVTMVLSGLVNKRLVAALANAGVEAAGLSGEDCSLLSAEPARAGLLGRTGAVVEVRPRLLHALHEAGVVPVISPVSRGTDGQPLNVNADEAASAIASALGADRLLIVSNVRGVLSADAVLEEVHVSEVEDLVSSGVATGGMATKLRAAALAARSGVREVRIGGLDLLGSGGTGTRVAAGPPLAVAV